MQKAFGKQLRLLTKIIQPKESLMTAVRKLSFEIAAESYALTHCRNCAAGWTRTGPDGSVKTVCLLDREVVWAAMTDCDRYEPRNES